MVNRLLLGMVLTVGITLVIPTVVNQYYAIGLDEDGAVTGDMMNRLYQRKTMADLRAMATATTGYFLQTGHYPDQLDQLLESGLVSGFSPVDMWGNEWRYRTEGDHYVLLSLGSDGTRGPEPPEPWGADDFDPDLVVEDGAWRQAPNDPGLVTRGQ